MNCTRLVIKSGETIKDKATEIDGWENIYKLEKDV